MKSLAKLLIPMSLVAIALTGCVWLSRRLINRLRQLWLTRIAYQRGRRYRIVEFYERFTSLVRERGLIRQPQQTQREFAESVASAFTPELAALGQTAIPDQLARFFYEVRFGELDLSSDEIVQIETLLIDLERALPKGTHGLSFGRAR